MMTFLWWLFVVLVVALTQNVSSTTSVRSHYNSRGRIKGETTNDLERHLQVDEQRETKKHGGNILLTLDQVVRSSFYKIKMHIRMQSLTHVLWAFHYPPNFAFFVPTVDRCFFG